MQTQSDQPSPQYPHSVLAGGQRLAQSELRLWWSSEQVQRVLLAARQRYGHALCSCRRQPLKLQIRLRDDKCHLAVWPHEHPAHDTECIFFGDEVVQASSAVAALRAAAIPPADPLATPVCGAGEHPYPREHTARPRLALTHAVTGQSAPEGTTPVSVKSLGLRLWEAASLCRWHPQWSRDWGRSRYQLEQAATEFTLNAQPLEEVMFVPRPYREHAAASLNREWDEFVRTLHVDAKRLPRLLIAPVRGLTPAQVGKPATALLRHLRGPIGLSQACFDFIARDCRTALANSRLSEHTHEQGKPPRLPELVGFFIVEPGTRGGVWARAGWLMAVHPRTYIPAANNNHVLLIDALVAGGYAFEHLVSEAPPSRRTAPDLLVRHVCGPNGQAVSRAALEVLAPSVSAEYRQVRAALAASMAAKGVPTWTWLPSGPMRERVVAPLPPHDHLTPAASQRVLQRIAAAGDAHYGYAICGQSNRKLA